MKRQTMIERRWLPIALLALLAVATSLAATARHSADKGSAARPSHYAPVKALVAYIERLAGRIESDLADREEYAEEHQERVAMRANALLAAAIVLGNHDTTHPLKSQAKQMIQLAEKLAESADDFDSAQKTLRQLQEVLAKSGGSHAADGPGWESSADIAELMKAVPIVNNSLRKGVTSRRFKRTARRTAMYAAGLAAIAQVSSLDDSYCDDEAATAKWKKLCFEMRDAAADAGRAVAQGDQEGARRAVERIVKTCDACHEDFR